MWWHQFSEAKKANSKISEPGHYLFKGALSVLRHILATESPQKMIENAFLLP